MQPENTRLHFEPDPGPMLRYAVLIDRGGPYLGTVEALEGQDTPRWLARSAPGVVVGEYSSRNEAGAALLLRYKQGQ